MNDPFYSKQEKFSRPKVTVQDKMDNRDCARLLDYYRMRVGNFIKNIIFFFEFYIRNKLNLLRKL